MYFVSGSARLLLQTSSAGALCLCEFPSSPRSGFGISPAPWRMRESAMHVTIHLIDGHIRRYYCANRQAFTSCSHLIIFNITMDPQLVLFRRQYLQLFEPDFLAWPPKSLLRDAGVQQWLYKHCFDTDNSPHLPSDRYRLRVLKPLLRKVEQAIEDPEEDVGFFASPPILLAIYISLFLHISLETLVLILFFLPRRFPMISCPVFPPS